VFLGRVVGCVWATVKDPQFEGVRLLLVQPVNKKFEGTGRTVVCADSTGARTGDLIYWVRGKEASFPFLPQEPPADAAIVGIVDCIRNGESSEAKPC
jgi:ethanolamine utilization protein EutN